MQVIIHKKSKHRKLKILSMPASGMWNEPTEDELARLPELYETEHVAGLDKMIGMHFFLGGCDWYAAEYSPADRIFFGYAILNADLINAEWGYISFDELRSVRTAQGIEVDRDLHWRNRKAGEVEKIVEAEQAQRRTP